MTPPPTRPAGTPAQASTPDTLKHRLLWQGVDDLRAFRGSDLFARIGGQATVNRLVDALYDRFQDDGVLRGLFARDLTRDRANQKRFFGEWLGGEPRYSDDSYSGLLHRHEDLPISRMLAGRWLGHFRHALEMAISAESDRSEIFAKVQALALALVNDAPPKSDHAEKTPKVSRHRSEDVATCGVGARTLKVGVDLAAKGQIARLEALLEEAPNLLRRPALAAMVMQAAALAGRAEVVRFLLENGVDRDSPHYLPISLVGSAFERVVFVTPLCAARMKGRNDVEQLLLKAGAKDDVFSAALLARTADLERWLSGDPELAQATDPAVDILDVTPVHHAVAGGSSLALQTVLLSSRGPLKGASRALRGAAARGDLEMVSAVLDAGADAKQIGVGRWVLHPELAPLLASRGATVAGSGDWIAHACTGNQNRKDDPEFVLALLKHGASVDDRRRDGSTAATALHYAAKAGFQATIRLLLERGADAAAIDDHGRTPLDWLQDAAPSVDKRAVRRLLDGGQ